MTDILLDVPIERAEQDALGRTDFAQSVAALIKSAPKATSSQVIGLYGKWGEGKTSVKNLVLETYKTLCELPPLIVEFSPWTYTSRERLPFLFFCEIAHCLGLESSDEKAQNLSTQFKSLGMILDVISNVPVLNVISGVAKPIVDHFGTTYSDQASDLSATRKHIHDLMTDEPRRLIVVIDDLDRISAEEVRRMIQLVKANGDFPNITYLLLCDRDYVSRALCTVVDGSNDEEGREYLEKVVYFGIDLPRIRTYDLNNYLVNLVQDVLTRHCIEQAEFDLGKELPPLVFQLVHDLRDVKRLVAGFEFQLSAHRKVGGGTANVHLGDLIVLEAYRLFEPKFYHALYKSRSELMGDNNSSLMQTIDKESALTDKWFNDNLLCTLSKAHEHTAREFVETHLGWHMNDKNYTRDSVEPGRVNFRLMHPDCFDCYFNFFVDPSHFSKADFLRLQAALTDKDETIKVLRHLFDHNRLRECLSLIESSFTVDDHAQQVNYVSALTLAAEFAQDNLPDMHVFHGDRFGFTLTTHLHRCALFFLESAMPVNACTELLMQIFRREKETVVLPASILAAEHGSRERQRSGTRLLSDDAFAELKQICAERIESLQTAGKLIGHVGEKDIRRIWLATGEPDHIKPLLAKDFENYPAVMHALWPFTGWSETNIGTFFTVDLDRLEEYVDPTSIIDLLEKQRGLPPAEEGIKKCLIFAVNAKRNKQPYDQNAQWREVYNQKR